MLNSGGLSSDYQRKQNNFEDDAGRAIIWSSRTALPAKMSKTGFSVWAFVKQCIGKDLTKISMPVEINEPISFLQRAAEYLEYSELVDAALAEEDVVRRMEYVCAFAVSGTSSSYSRIGKPFNPLLGETYEFHHRGFTYVSEQVSHHPPVTAFCAQSKDFRFWSTVQFKLRFWGKSIEVLPKGTFTLELPKYQEAYTWRESNWLVHNVLFGKIWVEHIGPVEVKNWKTGHVAHLEFHPSGWFGQASFQVTGRILPPPSEADSSGIVDDASTRVIFGNWTRGLFSVDHRTWKDRDEDAVLSVTRKSGLTNRREKKKSDENESTGNGNSVDTDAPESAGPPEFGFDVPLPNQRRIWTVRPRPSNSKEFYNFTSYTILLNELTPELAAAKKHPHQASMQSQAQNKGVYDSYLPPTDCRLRPDIRAMESGDLKTAAAEKNRLEEKQRAVRRIISQLTSAGHGSRTESHSEDDSRPGTSSGLRSSENSSPKIRSPRKSRSSQSITSSKTPQTPIVGPIWFSRGLNPYTQEEEWISTDEYIQRDWTRCPDIY
ncbi:unnamed protein product [Calicophoron daubneyi]|uniref:Oxysterol-binding protein n=1 Tax=Calicophoron daubneyi TaxID=300641 RepID=A0AAV2SWS4_CALDB